MEAPKRRWTRAEEAAFLRAKRPWRGASLLARATRHARRMNALRLAARAAFPPAPRVLHCL
jgi:hypothetical protein